MSKANTRGTVPGNLFILLMAVSLYQRKIIVVDHNLGRNAWKCSNIVVYNKGLTWMFIVLKFHTIFLLIFSKFCEIRYIWIWQSVIQAVLRKGNHTRFFQMIKLTNWQLAVCNRHINCNSQSQRQIFSNWCKDCITWNICVIPKLKNK